MQKEKLFSKYLEIFGKSAESIFFSPGRINLIGEHIDYNGGHAMPCAIDLGTYGVYGPRKDNQVALYSGNMASNIIKFALTDSKPFKDAADSWTNYFKGMLKYLQQASHPLSHGFNLFIYGNLPYGAGLSSSASIEMLIGEIVNQKFHLGFKRIDLARMGQKTENEFIGLDSGIMDQFACIMGQKNKAIFLDCNTLTYQYEPLDLCNYQLIIMSTNKKHSLADSSYNTRVKECQQAVKKLQQKLRINYLCELNSRQLDEYSYLINDEVELKRARHAVSENERTINATKALNKNDLARLGRLLNASHVSLHYDYEVSGHELDTLVETAWQQPGVLGARMIGGGFGGSAIAIVKKDQSQNFKKIVGQVYRKQIGYTASFYDTKIVDGTRQI